MHTLFLAFVVLLTLLVGSTVGITCWDSNNCCQAQPGRAGCNSTCISACVCQFYGLPSCCTGAIGWTQQCVTAAQQMGPLCYYPNLQLPSNCSNSRCAVACPTYPTPATTTAAAATTTTIVPTTSGAPTTFMTTHTPTNTITTTTNINPTSATPSDVSTSTSYTNTMPATSSTILTSSSSATSKAPTTTTASVTSTRKPTTQNSSHTSTTADAAAATTTTTIIDDTSNQQTSSSVNAVIANEIILSVVIVIIILALCLLVILFAIFRKRLYRRWWPRAFGNKGSFIQLDTEELTTPSNKISLKQPTSSTTAYRRIGTTVNDGDDDDEVKLKSTKNKLQTSLDQDATRDLPLELSQLSKQLDDEPSTPDSDHSLAELEHVQSKDAVQRPPPLPSTKLPPYPPTALKSIVEKKQTLYSATSVDTPLPPLPAIPSRKDAAIQSMDPVMKELKEKQK